MMISSVEIILILLACNGAKGKYINGRFEDEDAFATTLKPPTCTQPGQIFNAGLCNAFLWCNANLQWQLVPCPPNTHLECPSTCGCLPGACPPESTTTTESVTATTTETTTTETTTTETTTAGTTTTETTTVGTTTAGTTTAETTTTTVSTTEPSTVPQNCESEGETFSSGRCDAFYRCDSNLEPQLVTCPPGSSAVCDTNESDCNCLPGECTP